MKLIGLTGGSGSGKSMVSAYLLEKGAFIIDCDKIAHETILQGQPAYRELVDFFGQSILNADRTINRKRLAELVFSDEAKLQFLNACTHKYICKEIWRLILFAKEPPQTFSYIVIDAPLLYEAGLQKDCDEVWIVHASTDVRIKRIMERDAITYQQAKMRISAQKNWEQYKEYGARIIINNGTANDLKQKVLALLTV